MGDEPGTLRLTAFLTEDDRDGHHLAAEVLSSRAREAGCAVVALTPALEGFGRSGHLRSARTIDLARGLPVLLAAEGDAATIGLVAEAVGELVPGALVTLESLDT